MQDAIAERKHKYLQLQTTFQPSMFHVDGDSASYFVIFDRVQYKAPTFMECLKICFQSFQVLHLHYPVEVKNFWMFIQRELFSIKTEFDHFSPCVNALATTLREHQQKE